MDTSTREPKGADLALRGPREDFPNDPCEATNMRAFVAGFLAAENTTKQVADEVLMAVGEAVANAVRHGRRPIDPGVVEVACDRNSSSLTVTVTDHGPGFDAEAVLHASAPDLLAAGGRGYFLMRQLMGRVDVDTARSGTTVILGRDLPR